MEGDTVNKEVTETLGAMLPQVPLSGSTISYISDPYYELNDYINEGIIHDTKNAVTNLGNKVKVSGGVKTLLMKIAIQEKRIELAKTKKYYQKQVPKLEAELKLYKNKLERITRNATDEEKDDIEKTSKQIEYSMPTDVLEKFIKFLTFMETCSCKEPKWVKSYKHFINNGELQDKCKTCINTNKSGSIECECKCC